MNNKSEDQKSLFVLILFNIYGDNPSAAAGSSLIHGHYSVSTRSLFFGLVSRNF